MGIYAVIKNGFINNVIDTEQMFGVSHNPYPKTLAIADLTKVPEIKRRSLLGKKLPEQLWEYYQPELDLGNVSIAITNRCNLRCPHCYNKFLNTGNSEELSLEEIKQIIDKTTPANYLEITGGECTLRLDDVIEICKYAVDKFAYGVAVKTNGTTDIDYSAFPQELKEKIHFHFSLDGFEELNDSIRGKGSFNKTVASIKACKAAGFNMIAVVASLPKEMFINNKDYLQKFLYFVETELEPFAVATQMLLAQDRQETPEEDLLRAKAEKCAKGLKSGLPQFFSYAFAGGCKGIRNIHFRSDGSMNLRCTFSKFHFGHHTDFEKKRYFEIVQKADEMCLDCHSTDFSCLQKYIEGAQE